MHPHVMAALRGGDGLITTAEALNLGLSQLELSGLLRTGDWVAVRRGVYAERATWESLDVWVGRPRLRGRAVHRTMVEDHVLSHDSAAHELGLPILRPPNDLVHITRPHVNGSRTRFGVKHHGAVYREDQVVELDGLRVLDAARTAVDIGREHGITAGVCACDSALRNGVRRRDLWAALEPMRYWPGVRSARAGAKLADPGAESIGESLSRILVRQLGIGEPETQFELRDGTRWARCDLRVGRHVFEFDGRAKYQRRDEGGFALDDPAEVVWREKQRQDWICGFGLGISRIVWSDFWGQSRTRALDRLAREYAATEARFGTSIEDLRDVVVRRPPPPHLAS